MYWKTVAVLSCLTVLAGRLQAEEDKFNFTGLTGFPKGFIFSTATASYQVEGAWNVSGKGENIWDYFTHKYPEKITNRNNGDVACDSYHKYKEDVANIQNIGFKMYRFSLSWSRLFPSGYANESVNDDGVRYYNALIDELIKHGIEPMVTLYHWDLPQPLQEKLGGWLHRGIADIFGDYARAVFKLFGSKVRWWVTINEPKSVVYGYSSASSAPGINRPGDGDYIAGHNLIRAHAKAYRIYDKEFRKTQKGKVSIVLSGEFKIPKNASDPKHVEAAERANQFLYGWFGHPVFSKEGDYPAVMREYVDNNSPVNASRLPRFTPEEIQEIKGTHDFLAINHYSTYLAEPGIDNTTAIPSVDRDTYAIISFDPRGRRSECPWMQVTPEGFRKLLNWLKKEFNNPEMFVTENGYCDKDQLEDNERVYFYSEYLKQLLLAIKQDGVKVRGYTTWSIMDNFEWGFGYSKKFGLMRVDFSNPNRTRTMKKSARFFKELIHKNISSGNSLKINLFFISILTFAASLLR